MSNRIPDDKIPPNTFSRRIHWIHALASGKFKQGRQRLKSDDGLGNVTFCCLGVAQEIFGEENCPSTEQKDLLSPKGVEFLGITNYHQNRLASMNDNTVMGFEGIAEAISLIE